MTTPRIMRCPADGPPIAGDRDAADLLGDAFGQGAEIVVVPVERLAPEFFVLRTGVAGAVLQKFVTYRLHLVILGDISEQVGVSTSLRDLVRECNRGSQTWFVADDAELEARLTTGS